MSAPPVFGGRCLCSEGDPSDRRSTLRPFPHALLDDMAASPRLSPPLEEAPARQLGRRAAERHAAHRDLMLAHAEAFQQEAERHALVLALAEANAREERREADRQTEADIAALPVDQQAEAREMVGRMREVLDRPVRSRAALRRFIRRFERLMTQRPLDAVLRSVRPARRRPRARSWRRSAATRRPPSSPRTERARVRHARLREPGPGRASTPPARASCSGSPGPSSSA